MKTLTLLAITLVAPQLLWAQMSPISLFSPPKERGFDLDIQAQQRFLVDLYQTQTFLNTYHRDWSGFFLHTLDFNSEARIHQMIATIKRKLHPGISIQGGYDFRRLSYPEETVSFHSMSLGFELEYSNFRWHTRFDQISLDIGESDIINPLFRTEVVMTPGSTYSTYFVLQWPLRQKPQWRLGGIWQLNESWSFLLYGEGMAFQVGLCIQYHLTRRSNIRLGNQYNLVLGSSPSIGFHYDHPSPSGQE